MTIVDMHAHPLLDRLYLGQVSSGRDASAPEEAGRSLDFEELRRGQVGALVSSVYPFWTPARRSGYMDRCRDILNLLEAWVADHGDGAAVVTDPAGLELALTQGKIAFIHAVEGGHVLEGRSENLERLYAWGVRSLTLTHFMNNGIAASSFDPRRKLAGQDGLTPFGGEVVLRMNALGMIIDLAHSSERAFWQVMDLTRDPVIASHTCVRRFIPSEVCQSDEQIRAIARNGGVIGIVLSSVWLRRFKRGVGISDLVDNILHICSLVGVDYVGIGSDFFGTPRIRGVRTAADLPRIADRLSEAGLPDQDVAKIMGGNFLRVFRQVVTA